MAQLEIHKHKSNFKIEVYDGLRKKNPSYTNIIDRDPNKISLILMDLYLAGFPIEKAAKLFLSKVEKKDWMGL